MLLVPMEGIFKGRLRNFKILQRDQRHRKINGSSWKGACLIILYRNRLELDVQFGVHVEKNLLEITV